MKVQAHGLSIDVPEGWEARILRHADGEPFLHVGNFALDADAGQFGAAATAAMGADAVFAAVVEYKLDPHVAPGAGLFAGSWRARLRPGDFHHAQLQVMRPGHLGCQRFFTAAGRPFCLYAVIAPVRRRPVHLAGQLSAVLQTLRFD